MEFPGHHTYFPWAWLSASGMQAPTNCSPKVAASGTQKEKPPNQLRSLNGSISLFFWSGRLDLNQRPPEPHSRSRETGSTISTACLCPLPQKSAQITTISDRCPQNAHRGYYLIFGRASYNNICNLKQFLFGTRCHLPQQIRTLHRPMAQIRHKPPSESLRRKTKYGQISST